MQTRSVTLRSRSNPDFPLFLPRDIKKIFDDEYTIVGNGAYGVVIKTQISFGGKQVVIKFGNMSGHEAYAESMHREVAILKKIKVRASEEMRKSLQVFVTSFSAFIAPTNWMKYLQSKEPGKTGLLSELVSTKGNDESRILAIVTEYVFSTPMSKFLRFANEAREQYFIPLMVLYRRTVKLLGELHMIGIYHLDCHTGNILVQPENQYRTIIDFGMACDENDPGPGSCEEKLNVSLYPRFKIAPDPNNPGSKIRVRNYMDILISDGEFALYDYHLLASSFINAIKSSGVLMQIMQPEFRDILFLHFMMIYWRIYATRNITVSIESPFPAFEGGFSAALLKESAELGTKTRHPRVDSRVYGHFERFLATKETWEFYEHITDFQIQKHAK